MTWPLTDDACRAPPRLAHRDLSRRASTTGAARCAPPTVTSTRAPLCAASAKASARAATRPPAPMMTTPQLPSRRAVPGPASMKARWGGRRRERVRRNGTRNGKAFPGRCHVLDWIVAACAGEWRADQWAGYGRITYTVPEAADAAATPQQVSWRDPPTPYH